MEKPRHPYILGRAPPQIHVRRPQNTPPFGFAALWKRYREVSQTNHVMTSVESVADESASDSDRIQQEVGDQAEQVQSSRDQPANDPVFDTEVRPQLPLRQGRRIYRQRCLYRSLFFDHQKPAFSIGVTFPFAFDFVFARSNGSIV